MALGSNMRHQRHGGPRKVLEAAVADLGRAGLLVEAVAPIRDSAPLGPSRRYYANGAVVVTGDLAPVPMLRCLKALERSFGRRRGGRRWASRVLDCDIILWGGGQWRSPGLAIPHPAYRQRPFVLNPALAVAAGWRDPRTGLTIRHLHARLTRARPVP